ncbi:centrosomal protein 43-like [Rhopilema esculentum]|uniref:centrosomal protein 43-like n=1 Tax=Rhopilema esculentum TaxID=499914 RepID=UPI0031DBB834|eukprot:gene17518-9141_t
MSAEEDTELRDLVAQSLEANGVLNKIRAELRASVFLALEEQDSLKNSNMVNHRLKNFLSTKEGVMAASLVQDFLSCFHLDFTMAVFDPETSHNGKFDTRDELSRSLDLSPSSKDTPLLIELLNKNMHEKNGTRSVGKESAKGKTEDIQPGSPRSPSRIPQRVGQEPKSKSETSVGGDTNDHSVDLSFSSKDKPSNQRSDLSRKANKKSHYEDEDDELLAELGLLGDSKKSSTKSGGWTNSDMKKKPVDKENNNKMALGSLHDAPPIPGIGKKKDDSPLDLSSSGNWTDLAAIEAKINKLGFDVPKDDNYGYEDDFVNSSSKKSEEGLSITEEIEEDISIGSFAGSKGDDIFTTDQTVSQISANDFDYREDIEL